MRRNEILIETGELARSLPEPGVLVLDSRFDLSDAQAGKRAYGVGHVPGARFADLEEDLSAELKPDSGRHPLPSGEEAVAAFRRLGVCKDSRVVVYDDSNGAFASRAWWMLRWLGHEDVRILNGGFAAWQRAGLPQNRGDSSVAEGDFTGQPDQVRLISADELLTIDLTSALLCDARDPERFSGKSEPIDRIAGHIPGARNTPFAGALDVDGKMLATEQLRDLWVQYLDGNLEQDWIAMCGSGVTACHLAVSAMLAGAREPRLYAGSWSEWITDPERPVSG